MSRRLYEKLDSIPDRPGWGNPELYGAPEARTGVGCRSIQPVVEDAVSEIRAGAFSGWWLWLKPDVPGRNPYDDQPFPSAAEAMEAAEKTWPGAFEEIRP